MTVTSPAEGALLDRVIDATYPRWHDGLTRRAYAQLRKAQAKTDWGRGHRKQVALVEDENLLASAICYDLAGALDGRLLRICGIGTVWTQPVHSGRAYDQVLIERMIDQAAHDGAELALLFSGGDVESVAALSFETIPATDVVLEVAKPPRRGAPMTMIRGGEQRDLPAIVAMGRVVANPFRFHLDRGVDLVQHAITTKRLLAGLGPPGARQLHFFIAEEGITAAAYVVIGIAGNTWTLEECGDRDPSGARVGAILQALIAREVVESPPTIHAWLPHGFVPPQVTIVSSQPATETIALRRLTSAAMRVQLSGADALYWHNDIFQ